MAIWPFRKKQPEEARISANDPITADHWIVRTVEALQQAGYSVSGTDAMRQTAVYACIRVLAETIGSLPLVLYRRVDEDGKELARDHYLWPILHDSPNNFQTSLEFIETNVAHMCLRGNSFSFIERNGSGRINRLIPLPPDRIKVTLKDARTQEVEYEYTDDNGKQEVLPGDTIWHQKALSSDGFVGLSPIAMAKRTLQLAVAAEDHGIFYFQNGLRQSGFFKYPGRLSDTAKLNIKESAKQSFGGGNKFSVGILEQGMEWQAISLSNEDSQYLETRNFQVEEIARLFRVPAILIGHPDKSATYASSEQFMLSFVIHTVRPWLVRIEQSISKYLLTESERKEYFPKFKIEGILRGDTASRYAAYASAITSRWMNPNEVRALEDMNPREGGDEYLNPAIDTTKGGLPNAFPK